jgi:hypothetical protein
MSKAMTTEQAVAEAGRKARRDARDVNWWPRAAHRHAERFAMREERQ